MDRFVTGFDAVADDDLMLCPGNGMAYQRDRSHLVAYDDSYFDKCAGYEDQEIAHKINAGRIDLVNTYVSKNFPVADIGIGSGEFIKKRPHTFGYDVNPKAVAWLKQRDLWIDDLSAFRAFTFWDVLEHVDDPEADYFRHMQRNSYLFACLPVFADLNRIRDSRHYRPGEHLYYWTEAGFVDWMRLHGFCRLTRQTFETEAGRDSIVSFAFMRAFA